VARRIALSVALLVAPIRALADPPTPAREPCRTVAACRSQVAHLHRALTWQRHARHALARHLRVRFHRDVAYGITLAAAVFHVSASQMWSVARCESNLDPFSTNTSSAAAGLFQWLPSSWPLGGFSPYDPIAASVATAAHVAQSGWGAWVCRP
jgi:Transglycosylase-like domain